jgi:hypothetical protein
MNIGQVVQKLKLAPPPLPPVQWTRKSRFFHKKESRLSSYEKEWKIVLAAMFVRNIDKYLNTGDLNDVTGTGYATGVRFSKVKRNAISASHIQTGSGVQLEALF